MSNTDPWRDSIQEMAEELGLPADESVAAIRHEAASFGYPGPDCLVPEEIALLARLEQRPTAEVADLPDRLVKRLEHLRECAPCGALARSAQPDAVRHDAFLAAVRQLGATAAIPRRSPIVNVLHAIRRILAIRAARRERKRNLPPIEVA